MIPVLAFVFGLVVGSFLNAVIYRLSVKDSALRGRSYCPRCKHTLTAADLIPVVSFALLRGRCRYCRKPISIQYPAVELATAIAFSLLANRFLIEVSPAHALQWFVFAAATSFLIVIFMYDLLHYLILDAVVLPAIAVGFLGNLLLGQSPVRMLVAALAASGFFALQYAVSKGQWIGGGDIRLGFLMGVLLSWPLILVALFLAYVVGSIVGLGLVILGSKSFGSKIPFGTFLTVATFVSLLCGRELWDWYVGSLLG